ncbi:hypothetical protein D3C86_1680010 [compost metagenome]
MVLHTALFLLRHATQVGNYFVSFATSFDDSFTRVALCFFQQLIALLVELLLLRFKRFAHRFRFFAQLLRGEFFRFGDQTILL